MQNSNELKLANVAYWMIVIAGTIGVLMYFQNFLKVFCISFLIWYIVKKLRDLVSKIKIGKYSLPQWLVTIISTVAVFLAIYSIAKIIGSNFQSLAQNFPQYSDNISKALLALGNVTGVENLDQSFLSLLAEYKSSIVGYAGSFAGIVGQFIIILIYVVFLLLEETLFQEKIQKVLNTTTAGGNIYKTVNAVANLFDDYLSVKIFTSFLTGLLSYFALLIIGIELPALWAFIIFLFNFIPSVGSVVATLFPALFGLIQYGEGSVALTVLIAVGAIQILVGNVLDPRLMGSRLNISPLVVLLSLTLWGFLWGVVGMILSVPITATLIIIFGQFDNTRPLAILLSKNGEIHFGKDTSE
ncbi:Predicted PurR-regulated permease PerM [Reichenbachiella faecimaris]|uniref:Predicted PurR-regulated permease PerM n=1 Tax=Reichenbachiella faecimaris TaxID=692418 RepID=A0A1W2GLH5_REIFA|nr:AI-2E family transporter [Reichenbachiella faecimaris]SMD37208.1 Predicted PurR-regulated permease PerM [Reichenbachiella faecimaris]